MAIKLGSNPFSTDSVSINLPNFERPNVDLPDVDLGEVGRVMGDALSGIAGSLSETISETGERAREAVGTLSADLARMRPQQGSSTRPKVFAAVGVALLGVGLAALAVFFAPGSGARHRAALRRRLSGAPAMVQKGTAAVQQGIGTAGDSAKQVGDRAAELVRIPIDTARDLVGHRNGTNAEESVEDAVSGTVDSTSEALENVADSAHDAAADVANAAADAADTAADAVDDAAEAVKSEASESVTA
jgi:gas vesicle protein